MILVVQSDKLFWVSDIHIPAFGRSSLIPWEEKETCQNLKPTGIGTSSPCSQTTFSFKNYLLGAMTSHVIFVKNKESWAL